MQSRNYFPNIDLLIDQNKSFVDIAKNKTYYHEIAEAYELISARNKKTRKEIDFLRKFITGNCKGNRVLDIACGVGRHSRELAKFGFETYGIDLSKDMLKIAKSKDPMTQYQWDDMRKFSLHNKVDVAFCLWTTYNYLSTKKDMRNFLNCVYNSVKPKGFLILESRNFFKKSDNPEFRRRLHENFRYKIELLIRKKKNLKRKIQDAIYVYLITDKKNGKTYSSIDTELVKIYTKRDIQNLIKNRFKICQLLGDYSNTPYHKNTSDRLIFILQKLP